MCVSPCQLICFGMPISMYIALAIEGMAAAYGRYSQSPSARLHIACPTCECCNGILTGLGRDPSSGPAQSMCLPFPPLLPVCFVAPAVSIDHILQLSSFFALQQSPPATPQLSSALLLTARNPHVRASTLDSQLCVPLLLCVTIPGATSHTRRINRKPPHDTCLYLALCAVRHWPNSAQSPLPQPCRRHPSPTSTSVSTSLSPSRAPIARKPRVSSFRPFSQHGRLRQ